MKNISQQPDNFFPLSLKDKVRVIDPDETPSECAVFQIASIENNRLALTTLDKQTTYEPFWVKRQDVRL
ncbi:hypothetical protein, partial [Hyella patelloides]|uniref:hypothetical protein n=1 Tax=Hyella patelloides TaxID=1982969 RepID=UPI0011A4444F